jgi:hypothetical protein
MLAIVDCRVSLSDGVWKAACVCGKESGFSTKDNALKMLSKGSCRSCKVDYRQVSEEVPVYKNTEGKWCSVCSGCGKEQAYTRKNHAKQSELSDWQCKKCVAEAKGFSANMPVGNLQRVYNKFRKSANVRRIAWGLNIHDFEVAFNGKCALTGWDISLDYTKCTASLDRIDSKKGYEASNIQWVHTMVNMCKNKYEQDKFIDMCKAVAATKS